MSDLETFLRDIVETKVPGDVIEAGVWKGGACIFMRSVLDAIDPSRVLYVADSFSGVPAPDPEKYPVDKGDCHHAMKFLSVSQEDVQANFRRYPTIGEVRFVKGLFKDTLHLIAATFSLIRLDGDLYESTLDSMKSLYPKLSIGGYCLIDDWGGTYTAGPAVKDYMKSIGASLQPGGGAWLHGNGIVERIAMNGPCASWKKLA